MLKLRLQYFGHLTRTDHSLERSLMLGKIKGRRRGHQRMRWLDSITDAINMNLGKLREMVKDREAGHAAVHGVPKSWTRLSNWTTATYFPKMKKKRLYNLNTSYQVSFVSSPPWVPTSSQLDYFEANPCHFIIGRYLNMHSRRHKSLFLDISLKKIIPMCWDFPGGSMAKTLGSQYWASSLVRELDHTCHN